MDAIEAIFARRSQGRLVEPAPSDEELALLLRAAEVAPDHGELRPWSFTVLQGDSCHELGAVFAEAYRRRVELAGGEVVPDKLEKERTKLGRAPVVIVAAARHVHDAKVPWIEQQMAVAAACQNILLAATALGYGSMWRTGDNAYDDHIKASLGLGEHDAIIGYLYLGTIPEGQRKPPRPR